MALLVGAVPSGSNSSGTYYLILAPLSATPRVGPIHHEALVEAIPRPLRSIGFASYLCFGYTYLHFWLLIYQAESFSHYSQYF